ncbi:MAG: sodium:solute symporter family protein [Pseudomonadota bacterium]
MEAHQAVGTILDYGIIIVYFVSILGFGSFFGRHTHSTKDFFFGGQRFSWWIISFSLVATTVGSYSFIKYSRVAFTHGISSTMSYTNDWFWMPMLMFVWLPIVFFSRITSVPEYFDRRFNRTVRLVTTIVILIYLIGYVGINLLTMGVALKAMLGWNLYAGASVVAVVCGIYVTAGGQTSVIMTDLVQGIMLLVAGFLLFALGISTLGGLDQFWSYLSPNYRLPLNYFNHPPEFNFIGVFWQDGVSQSMFAYFLNQGMIMRFLSAKSPQEGRKACVFLLLVLQILAAIAVSNAGWVGRAMVTAGLLPADTDPQRIFVVVSAMVCQPGVFGFVMAALTAALMSTADTLLNATSAVAVNDIYRPYFNKKASDKHYLKIARWVSIVAALIGLVSVPLFNSFKSIYAAHGAFTAIVSPPMAAALMMGAFWRRFNTPGALGTILGGSLCLAVSLVFPEVISPFSFGVPKGGEYLHAWVYQRALFGLVSSFAIGIFFTLRNPPPDPIKIRGLVWGTIDEARRLFKGGEPNLEPGPAIILNVVKLPAEPQESFFSLVQIGASDCVKMNTNAGDIVQVAHTNGLYGGLRSFQAKIRAIDTNADSPFSSGTIGIPENLIAAGNLKGTTRVRVQKII